MKQVAASMLAARLRWRGWVVFCLLVALPLYGVSATVTALIGALHFHTATVEATPAQVASGSMQGWHDFRRMTDRVGPMTPPHAHDALGRHVHMPGDASVTVIGNDGSASIQGGATPSTGVSFDAVPATALVVPTPHAQPLHGAWRTAAEIIFLSLTPSPLERPPNADCA